MAREHLCQAGNCQATAPAKDMILLRETDGAQYRFCSYRHVAEWATSRALRTGNQPLTSHETCGGELKLLGQRP